MVSPFDEPFYRSKRAALLASFILILADAFHPHTAKDVTLYIFRMGPVSEWLIILLGLLVCVYLNLAYFLHYRTEVPAWRRSPESGLQEVEALRRALEDSMIASKNEREEIVAYRRDTANHLEILSSSLNNFVVTDFPQKLENAVIARLENRMGEIRVSVFNQISAAINSDSKIARLAKEGGMSWDKLTNEIIERTTEKIVGAFSQQYEEMLTGCRDEIRRHMAVTRDGLAGLESREEARLASLRAMADRYRKTEAELRSWFNAMNLRVRVHYLYLPLLLFIVAAGWSLSLLLWPIIVPTIGAA